MSKKIVYNKIRTLFIFCYATNKNSVIKNAFGNKGELTKIYHEEQSFPPF